MKTLKISEELHQDIKKYCAENSKNVQDIVEDKLSELVHKEFNIGSMQIIGTDTNTVTFTMEKDSVITMTELFKKLVLNKPLENVDIITDLIKSIKTLEYFIEQYNEQDKVKKADEKVVKEFFDSEKSHLSSLHEEMVKNLNEKEKEKEVVHEEMVKNLNENENENEKEVENSGTTTEDIISENIKKIASKPSEVVKGFNNLNEESIRLVADSLGIKDENGYNNLRDKLLFDAKSVSGDYDVQVDGLYYEISEFNEKTKIAILKNHGKEKSVDVFSLLETMNPNSSSFNDNLEKVKSMFNILTLPQHLEVFENYNDLPLSTCNWIYTLDGSNKINHKISKQDDFYIHIKDNTIDIISKDIKNYNEFVQPHLLEKFNEAINK